MATTTQIGLKLTPYIFFYGKCEEALEFYKEALGGTYELQRIAGTPIAGNFAPDFQDKVMHAKFTAGDLTFLAADGRSAKAIDPEEGNISLTIEAADAASGEQVFKALSEGGAVRMPFDDAFWGGKFGQFVDRFGIEWMVVAP